MSAYIIYIIVPFIDNLMFNVKYLAMHKVQMHAGAISKFVSVRAKNTRQSSWIIFLYRRTNHTITYTCNITCNFESGVGGGGGEKRISTKVSSQTMLKLTTLLETYRSQIINFRIHLQKYCNQFI